METELRGTQLIQNLLKEPATFNGNELVKEYFRGFPIETLRPLLSHDDPEVRRVAVCIASELGERGRPVIATAVGLIDDDDRFVRFYASDIVAVCSLEEDVHNYVHVVRRLEDGDDVVRVHAMFLMSNASRTKLKAAADSLSQANLKDDLHKRGLSQLVNYQLGGGAMTEMLESGQALLRKYGALAVWRYRDRVPELVSKAKLSNDVDIRKFWEQRERQGNAY